jgi:intein/homing endonuclease
VNKVNVNIIPTDDFNGLELPQYETSGAAGFDFRAAITDNIIINPGCTELINTGLIFEIPEGFELQVRPRSGLAAKNGITVLNSPGTVDCVPSFMKIKTAEGDKTIENFIENKTTILSYNTNTKEYERDEVLKIWEVGERDVVKIEFDDGTEIVCTDTQLILTENGWKQANELTEKDNII